MVLTINGFANIKYGKLLDHCKKAKVPSMPPLLETKGITLQFGGLIALYDVSISVEERKIVSLIGPNGAGKSTMFNCINGLYRGFKGSIFLQGKEIQNLPPHKISRLGISRTYQNLELFSNMTVIENILVGYHQHIKTNFFSDAFRLAPFRRETDSCMTDSFKIMELLGLLKYRDCLVSELPYGTLKRVEIGRALAMKPFLLLLDEPTCGMNEQETEEIAKLIVNLNRDLNVSILLVEHDMSVVMGISDLIYVLNHGQIISKGSAEEVKRDPEVIRAFLGGE